jgi:hypothetical protein
MTDYRERLVRRAARTAARETMLLQRVNNAFSKSVEAVQRSKSFAEIAADLDTLRLKQSVYSQEITQPIIEAMPGIISDTKSQLDSQ